MRFEYYPLDGSSPLVFDADQRLTITRAEGLTEAGIAPVVVISPGQYGESATDIAVASRVIPLTLAYVAVDHADMLAMRRTLARAFFIPPRRAGDRVPPTVSFRCYPPDGIALELRVIPRNGPVIDQRGSRGFVAAVELLAPYPFWREVDERFVRLEQAGGFQFPVSFPQAFPAYQAQQDVQNTGNVPVGLLMRLYGNVTVPRLRNLTTGEVLEIGGSIPDGSYVEVDTRFGHKLVELVDATGVRTRIMSRLNLARADFWQMLPGLNTIRFEADAVTSGAAAVFLWRPEMSGV